MQTLEERAAPRLSAKVKAAELISRARSLKHIIKAEIGKTKIKCPINTYIEPAYSLIFIFIVPFHLFYNLSFSPSISVCWAVKIGPPISDVGRK